MAFGYSERFVVIVFGFFFFATRREAPPKTILLLFVFRSLLTIARYNCRSTQMDACPFFCFLLPKKNLFLLFLLFSFPLFLRAQIGKIQNKRERKNEKGKIERPAGKSGTFVGQETKTKRHGDRRIFWRRKKYGSKTRDAPS